MGFREWIVGVRVSVQAWRERFASHLARQQRRRLAAEILAERLPGPAPVDETIEELRQR